MSDCPSREQLFQLVRGQLDGAAFRRLEEHLEKCCLCAQELDKILEEQGGDFMPEVPPPAPSPPSSATGFSLSPGQTFGDFEILEPIARGGMGEVYKARQVILNRLVAFKKILKDHHTDPQDLARFRVEAEAAARLQHPNIVPVYQVGGQDETLYLAMELVAGGSLAKELAGSPQPARRAAALVETLARAIHHAHEQGIVHRDLKPANVLLAADATPKIADFGLAKRLDANDGLTATNAILGTPSYMAPEQADRKFGSIGPATDVYALGAILYEMLTGRVPFKAEKAVETLLLVIHEEPVPPRRFVHTVPYELELLCLKCLEKDPKRRYASALQLAQELRHWLNGEPMSHTRPVGLVGQLAKWCQRKPALAVAISVVTLALVAVTVVSILYGIDQANYAKERSRYANQQEEAASRLRTQQALLKETLRRSAVLALNQGLNHCEDGEVNLGMHWLMQSLKLAIETDVPDVERAARLHLAAWGDSSVGLPLQQRMTPAHPVFSPDGKIILTGGRGIVRYLDAATGKLLRELRAHDGEFIETLAISPNGKVFLTASWTGEKEVCLWELSTGKRVGTLRPPGWVLFGAFSPGGEKIVTVLFPSYKAGVSYETVWIWTRTSAPGQPLRYQEAPLKYQGVVEQVAFSPDWNTILTCSRDKTALLWDLSSRDCIRTFDHPKGVTAVAFSPDGTTIVTGDFDGKVCFWNLKTGKPTGPLLQHGRTIRQIAFNPDGKIAVIGVSGGTARLWLVSSRKPLGPLLAHGGQVGDVSFSPDGKYVLTGSEDGTDRLWKVPVPKEGTIEQMELWVRVVTGTELDENGKVRPLDVATRQKYRKRLQDLGGPPLP
jgi:tRNA A-37 threonylcarbamoyl transferase component Bud32